ncbi:MAG: 2Fe-2S iron-sulfur cluster-binding protein [Oscillospiraceae bacterium]
MADVNITINEKNITVPAGTTILEAARANGVHIPTLCFLEKMTPRANCRMCLVEVDGARTFQHSCATKVRDGMVVHTDTPAIREARKLTLELLLSHHAVDCHHCMRIGSSKCDDLDPKFCEMCFFCDCVKDGFCELQSLAREYKVDLLPFSQKFSDKDADISTPIVRNPSKCIKCKHCLDVCNDVQTVHNLCASGRGCDVSIGPAFGKDMAHSDCVGCGRCVDVCPTGAIFVREHKDELIYNAHEYGMTTVAQISRNVLPELQKLFKLDVEPDIRTLVYGLKKIGVDYVFTEDFALAEVQKQAAENIYNGAAIITNSPAAKKFSAKFFPDVNVSTYPSTQQFFGSFIREKFAPEKGIDTAKLKIFNVTNDNENAVEASESGSADIVVNARELYRIFLRTGVDLKRATKPEPDSLSETSADYEGFFAPGKWSVDSGVIECELNIGGKLLKAASVHTLGCARRLLDDVRSGKSKYDIIRLNA